MRRLLLFGALATQLVACASGMRPVRQLNDMDVMVGGGINGPGAEFDPELSAWVRFAPSRYFDITAGGMMTVPLFEPIAGGALGELRGHITLSKNLRLTLDVAGELIRYDLEIDPTRVNGADHIWAQRITAMPLLVWTGPGTVQPYFGPKIMYLSHMDKVSSASLGSSPGFREGGSGVVMLGGTFGLESEVDVFRALGTSLDVGFMVDAERGDLDGLYMSIAGYIGY